MDSHYLESRGWTRAAVDDSGMVDPFTGDRRNPERAEAMQRARDAAEERAVWAQFAAPLMASPVPAGSLIGVEHPECVVAKVAGVVADAMLAEYRKRFRGEAK